MTPAESIDSKRREVASLRVRAAELRTVAKGAALATKAIVDGLSVSTAKLLPEEVRNAAGALFAKLADCADDAGTEIIDKLIQRATRDEARADALEEFANELEKAVDLGDISPDEPLLNGSVAPNGADPSHAEPS